VDETSDLERLLGQHSRAALFVYLAVEQRVSRESLITIFWPESDAEHARHALRQSLYHLRRVLGAEWIDSRAHELVVSDEVRTDAQAFTQALERGDAGSAVRLYQGPFLDGVHLADLQPWENWVDSRRTHYARAFRKASRDLLEERRAAGDLRGAIEAAERWSARDPLDDEAQHRLIEALAAAGERAEAIRQYESYARMLEPDGLRPLDETQQLAERLRSESIPLPPKPTATVPVPQSVPQVLTERVTTERSTVRSPRLGLVAVAALIVFVASVWGLRSLRVASGPASPTTIAVLPFSVRADASVQYLGEGMVNLLATALDGAGSLRPADTRATFAALAEVGRHVIDSEDGNRVAARLGAGLFVLGDIVEAGGMLQIEAAVYGAGRKEPRGRAVVSGAADSVFELVDRLAARLLGEIGDPSADRLRRTAALTTASLPAFKSYLQGEGRMRAGEFERAADDYLAAIALDSTFAVAHYRLALAREWAPLLGNEEAAGAAARHGARLSARDSMLLEAFRQWRSGDATRAERAYHAILARYPDDIDAWFQLGEIQFHHGPLLGRPLDESEVAWQKVLSHEPRNLFALTHVARIALVTRRFVSLDSLLRQFGAEELSSDRRLEELMILRAAARGDTAAALALAKNVARGESFSIWRVAVYLTAFSPDHALMTAVIQELTKDDSNPAPRADLLWFASMLELARGRVLAAQAARDQAVEAERASPANRRRSAFQAVTEWHAATLPLPYADSTLIRVRQRAASLDAISTDAAGFESVLGTGTPIRLEPLRQYTLGILSLRLGDSASAASAATKLERIAASRSANTLVRDLDRGLRARIAWKERRPDEAIRLLEAIETTDPQGEVAATPFMSRANERFLHAEILASLGRQEEALRWFASLGDGSVTEIPLKALSHFRQAEIHERLGNHDRARSHYSDFLALWRDADLEFRPLVDVARQRLTGLGRSD
jgi:DNA-binding SARP family transcriptional activator